MRFFIAICLLAGIAAAIGSNFEDEPKAKGLTGLSLMPPGAPTKPNPWAVDYANLNSPTYWSLNLVCDYNSESLNLFCAWMDWNFETEASQPIHKDVDTFQFELMSDKIGRETGCRQLTFTNFFARIKASPQNLPSHYRQHQYGIETIHYMFDMKVSCMREKGTDSILWCKKRIHGRGKEDGQIPLERESQREYESDKIDLRVKREQEIAFEEEVRTKLDAEMD